MAFLKKKVMVLVLLMLFGAVRLPMESRMEEQWATLHLRQGDLDLSMREKMGQLSFAAALGGFRSLIASLLTLEAYTAWENVEWLEVEKLYGIITKLQPRVAHYWEVASWNLAYNAYSYYLNWTRPEMRDFQKKRLAKIYLEKGRKFLEEGIRNNPQSYRLYAEMAVLYDPRNQKLNNAAISAKFYKRAAECPGAPNYYRRFYAYKLAQIPGREEEAYRELKKLYDLGPRQRVPALLLNLLQLQFQLEIPLEERIPLEESFPNPENAYKLLKNFYREHQEKVHPKLIEAIQRLEEKLDISENERLKK